ncbi:MAG: hypothetical protein C0469_06805 [Cyanobacteria bacterium DS2.3.42]|nr:hypothetical protein [Cyanobacteria bacterium DS2.3.42]
MMIIQSLIIALSLTVQATMAIETDGNFFSSPSNSDKKLPRYRTDAKPAEKIRGYIQANTPELEQVRLISSLKGKQREEIVKAYERGRAELQPMNAEFNQLRKGMSPSVIEKMLSKEEPQMDAMTKSEDFELLLKSRSMLQKLRSKRLSLWEEIQAKLSPTQLDELDKLKSGQVPVEYMNSQEATNEIKVDPQK